MKLSQSSRPFISVIVPVYNGEAHIAQAISSILAQTRPADEVLIIDDGSSDNTSQQVKKFGSQVRYHYQDNAGSSAARNHGIHLAKGDLIAFLDADDLWAPEKLGLQCGIYGQHPGVDVVWGHVIEFYGERLPADIQQSARAIAGHHPGTALIRSAVFSDLGGFSQQYDQAEVVEWASRLLSADINQHMLEQVVMYRRIHDTNKGINNDDAKRQYLQLLKKHLDRKRAMQS